MSPAAAPASEPVRTAAAPPVPLLRRSDQLSRDERQALQVVPRRRGAVGLVAMSVTALFVVLLGVTVFQTRLAERQLQLDQIERQVRSSRDRYDQLRQVRAELRSPERLAAEALVLGMVPGSSTEFVEVSPDVVALVIAATGPFDDGAGRARASSLDDFRTVKGALGVAP